MNGMDLSKRLNAATAFVSEGSRVVDVGTDHGFVPIYLIGTKKAEHVIAMDINEGPLEKARLHVEECGFHDRIELRLSDGLKELGAGEADTMICAGMGGLLMMRIISEGNPIGKGIKHMILQPQSDLCSFRQFLYKNDLVVEAEAEIFEEGKYYTVMSVKPAAEAVKNAYKEAVELITASGECDTDRAMKICHRFGPYLIARRDNILFDFLRHELHICDSILLKLSEHEHTDRMRDIMNKKNDITFVLDLYS